MNIIERKEIAGRKCHIYIENPEAPYIYWAMQMHEPDDVERMISLVKGFANEHPFNLIAFEANNWNADFSPWKAPAVFGTESFDGEGQLTYEWLIHECIPYVESLKCEKVPVRKPVRYIAGYSLAGLFALWAFYKGKHFNGAASCSGSLWFPEWLSFIKDSSAPEDSFVYLSLGTKEEKTKNPTMATVGDVTREMAELLKEDSNVIESVLEWNPGGHFNNPAERTAKGIAWLLQQ